MTGWLIDTFVWTGLLIAAVLLVRRPVSRWFGPQIAYALWALPFLRLVMPPLVLPAWMAPSSQPAEPAVGEPFMIILSDTPESTAAAPVAAPVVGIEVTDLLLPLWLGGAVVFLALRFREYLAMRRDLLAEARPVGEAGKVRLVETPAVSSPVAFGIADKVVALPPDFMALHDLNARDLAIAHELAHHRGHDLVANVAAQPLLALHWFNPLAWWGWRAMRRDQEAACDARVVAGRERSVRAAYAQVIAGFAAGPNLAMAAPMACPVLGEKSIIHRLRSLTMTEISPFRRRMGLLALGTAALALPLTASITYARGDSAPQPPAPPEAPSYALAPQPPGPPAAPGAPLPPKAPLAPQAPDAPGPVSVDPDTQMDEDTRQEIRREVRIAREEVREAEEIREVEMERMFEQLEESLAELENLDEVIEFALAQADEAMDRAHVTVVTDDEATALDLDIECSGDEPVVERELSGGKRAMVICQGFINEQAAKGLREARKAIAANREIPEETRRSILRQLDNSLARYEEARKVSFTVPVRFVPVREVPRAMVAPVRVNRSETCETATTLA